jgi:DNA repair exonuclease SbcCD ATPase subunit
VGSPDEQKKHSNGEEPNDARGNDLLYGWLVGRAAADLGLAQALAVSESRRNDQFKRLEVNLLAQVRELHNSQTANGISTENAATMEALKAEIERINTRQHNLEAGQISSDSLETVVHARLREFENQIKQQQAQDESGHLGDFKFELTLLADRVARAEFSTQQAQVALANQQQRVDEQIDKQVEQQLAALKAQIIEELRGDQPSVRERQNLEASLQKRIDELRGELSPAAHIRDEVGGLQTELATLAHRLSQIEAMPDPAITLAEEQQLNLRLNELTEVVQKKLQSLNQASSEGNSQAAALATCFERLARLEDRARIGTADLKAEICALKTRLDEPARKFASDERNFAGVEQSLNVRLSELQEQINQARLASERRDAETRGLNVQLTNLTETVSRLATRAGDQIDAQVQYTEWQRQIEQSFSHGAHELENLLNQEREQREKSEVETIRLKDSLISALNRLGRIELAHEQAQVATVVQAQRTEQNINEWQGELASLKIELSRQSEQQVLATAQAMESHFDSKIDELQSFLAAAHQDQRAAHTLLNEMRNQSQLIAQRLAETESNAQQTHALMVNETEQAAQLRSSLMGDLAALQSQLAQRQARDAQVDGVIAELSERFEELQGQLRENWTHATNRDGEIADLKNQMQNFVHQLAAKSAGPLSANRTNVS